MGSLPLMGLRWHPQGAGLFLVDVADFAVEERSEKVDDGLRVALHDVMLGVRHSEELRFTGLEVGVGHDDPIGAL